MPLPVEPLAPGRARGYVRFAGHPTGGPPFRPTEEVWAYRAGEPIPPLAPGGAPAGIILCLDRSAALAVPPGVPAVAGVDPGLLRESERVAIDGSAGTLEIDGVREVRVVTAFLQRPDGRILLLRRSEQVGSFQGHWAAVSGYLEDPSPAAQVLREVREETGVSDPKLTLVGPGDPVLSRDGNRVYVVHPFRVDVPSDEVRLNWEHTEFEWVDAAEMGRRPTVPHLQRAWERVRALPRPKP